MRISKGPFFWLIPAVVVLLAITMFPFLYSLYLSTLNYDISKPYLGKSFVGIGNYVQALTNPRSLNSFKTTALFVSISVSLQSVIGLFVALVMQRLSKWRTLFIGLIIVPMLLPKMIVGLLWRIMYHPLVGIVNYLLGLFFNIHPIEWLSDPSLALLSVIAVDVWQWTPFMILILSAGLEMLPKEPFEAAQLDGANGLQILGRITLPLLAPIFIVAFLFRLVEDLRTFDIMWVMTAGGPGTKTETLDIYAYLIGMSRGGRISYASTLSVLLLIFTILILTIFTKAVKEQ
jgi:multiple sugar transport system permease protein